MNTLGFAGLPATMNGFKSKADALKFAIEFTASSDSSFQRKPSYQAAQDLFDFICKNVSLPDIEQDKAADLLDYAKTALQMQLDKSQAPDISDPYITVYATAKDLGYKNVQGTGSDDGCSDTLQLRKDDYEYTVTIGKRKITF